MTENVTELVCPLFYVEQWRAEGSKRTVNSNCEAAPVAADDGVCRLVAFDDRNDIFTCRCGLSFFKSDAQHVELGK